MLRTGKRSSTSMYCIQVAMEQIEVSKNAALKVNHVPITLLEQFVDNDWLFTELYTSELVYSCFYSYMDFIGIECILSLLQCTITRNWILSSWLP